MNIKGQSSFCLDIMTRNNKDCGSVRTGEIQKRTNYLVAILKIDLDILREK